MTENNLDIFLDKFYIFPEEIDAGFITEDSTFIVTLLSLFRTEINVTSVDKFNIGGIIIQHEVTPFAMPPNCNKFNDLTVLGEGPPQQDSLITYFIDADPFAFELPVTGQRITPFLYECDFTTVEISLLFDTLKYQDIKGNEQRRSIAGVLPRKDLSFDVWENANFAQRLRNDIRRFLESILAVPVFHEPLHIVSDPKLLTKITTEEDFTFYPILQKGVELSTQFLIIKTINSENPHEIKEITTIDNGLKEINFSSAVTNSYVPKETIAYPVVICYLDTPEIQRPNEDMLKVPFRFKEFV